MSIDRKFTAPRLAAFAICFASSGGGDPVEVGSVTPPIVCVVPSVDVPGDAVDEDELGELVVQAASVS